MNDVYEYGVWGATITSVVFFALFALTFFFPRKKREWRTLGFFQAFVVALYTEMYGFPLTIYILSTFFGIKIPFIRIKGHLWASLLGWGDQGAILEMAIGVLVMYLGMGLVIIGWWKIHKANGALVVDGIYRIIRHPQYLGFILITTGMLIHWPTLPTLLMFPILLAAYLHLAKKEDKELLRQFKGGYLSYKQLTPAFLPLRIAYSAKEGLDGQDNK